MQSMDASIPATAPADGVGCVAGIDSFAAGCDDATSTAIGAKKTKRCTNAKKGLQLHDDEATASTFEEIVGRSEHVEWWIKNQHTQELNDTKVSLSADEVSPDAQGEMLDEHLGKENIRSGGCYEGLMC